MALITTTKGDMDESLLEKKEGSSIMTTSTRLGSSIGWKANLYTVLYMFN